MEAAQPARAELFGGPYRSGKTLRLLEEIIQFKKQNPLATVLVAVPSARYQTLLKSRAFQIAHQAELPGLAGVEIVPFYHVCRRVLQASGTPYRVLPDEVRLSLMRTILQQMVLDGQLTTLADVSAFTGTAQAVADLIDEFQRAALSPMDVISSLNVQAADDSRYQELANVYQNYWNRLTETGFFDLKRIALKAREVLHSPDALPDDFHIDFFACDGFDRVSRLQGQVIGALARRSSRTIITFDHDFKTGWDAEASVADAGPYAWKHSSLSCIKAYIDPVVSMIERSPRPTPRVTAFRTLDRFLEMQEIASRCKQAVVERSIAPEQLLVVCRSIDAYRGAIESAFESAGLSCFIDASIEVSSLPAWHFLRRLVSLSKDEYPRRQVIDLLRSPYFNLQELGLDFQTVSQLDKQSFEQKIVGGKSAWLRFASSQNRLAAISHLVDATTPPEGASPATYVSWVENLVDSFMTLPASQVDARTLRATEEREVVKSLRSSVRVMLLDQQVAGERRLTYEEFLTHLTALMDKATFACPHPAVPSVTICSAELAPNHTFKEVYIAGLLEGEFPRRRRDRGFLAAGEISRWLSYGIDLRDPRHEPGFEKALFHSLVELSADRVCMSLPEFDISGDEMTPSFYLKEMEGTAYATKVDELPPFQRAASRPSSAAEFMAAALWNTDLDHTGQLAAELGLAHIYDDISERASCLSARAGSMVNNVYNGYLSDFFSTGALKQKLPEAWTASRLNQYGQCPFRYWVSNVLKLEPRDEAKSGLSAKLRGQFYHKTLELFFRSLMAVEADKRDNVREEYLDRAFDAALGWLESQSEFQPGDYWTNEKNELKFRICRFVEKEMIRLERDQMQPAAFEVPFGTTTLGSFPGLIIESPEGNLFVRGTIDRIDVPMGIDITAGDHETIAGRRLALNVIDYKLGGSSIQPKDAFTGRNLQIPLYALAAERSIFPGSRVTGGSYLSVNQARSVGRLEFDPTQQLKETTEEFVRTFARKITEGDFAVRPSARKVCSSCPHATACRIKEIGSQWGTNDGPTD